MVKGNAERRKELSVLRREAKKAEGERKLGGSLLATPGEARARLLNDAKKADGGEDGLTGWTLANVGASAGAGGDEGDADADGRERGGRSEKRKVRGKRGNARSDAPTIKTVCEHFFRTGFCEIRRCKHEHIGETIEHLRNVPPAPETSDGCLPLMSKPLRRCDGGRVQVYEPAIRRTVFLPSPLRFVAWGNKLVFDAANPEVFAEYCRVADAGTNKSLRRQQFEQQRWTVKLHPRLSPQFRLAVRTVLLSAARFAWQTAAAVDSPASPDRVALAAGPVAAAADDTSSDSSSSDSGSDSPDSDAEHEHVAGHATVAPAPSPAAEVRLVRLRLEAEIWHRILSFLVRGDWPDLPSVGRTRQDGHHQNRPG